jgi:hypothetical protein
MGRDQMTPDRFMLATLCILDLMIISLLLLLVLK